MENFEILALKQTTSLHLTERHEDPFPGLCACGGPGVMWHSREYSGVAATEGVRRKDSSRSPTFAPLPRGVCYIEGEKLSSRECVVQSMKATSAQRACVPI